MTPKLFFVFFNIHTFSLSCSRVLPSQRRDAGQRDAGFLQRVVSEQEADPQAESSGHHIEIRALMDAASGPAATTLLFAFTSEEGTLAFHRGSCQTQNKRQIHRLRAVGTTSRSVHSWTRQAALPPPTILPFAFTSEEGTLAINSASAGVLYQMADAWALIVRAPSSHPCGCFNVIT